MTANNLLADFFSLIYPRICFACGKGLYKQEKCLCAFCRYHLPKTNYHLEEDNPLSRLFWGRVNLGAAAAYYHFDKGSKVQHLIHNLKYHGHQEIGTMIGTNYGIDLKNSTLYRDVDAVLPVPLHPKKQKRRGYNQSESFARGIASALGANCITDGLFRAFNSSSQTLRSRFERWKNVETIFGLYHKDSLQGKHLLLVDDVVTTGATLEACAQVLLGVPGARVSVATIACAA